MLVLSRKKGEKIIVSPGPGLLEIIVVEVRGDKVRLGIIASKEWAIHRQEVWDVMQAQKSASTQPAPPTGSSESPPSAPATP